MTTTQITISGGFHGVADITVRAKHDAHGDIKLSSGQYKRINAHMCGVKGCICSIRHGWLIDGASRDAFVAALENAAYEASV